VEKTQKKLIVFMPSIEDGGVEKNLYLILNYLSNKIANIKLITFDNKKKIKFKSNIEIITPALNFSFIKSRYPKYLICLIKLLQITLFNRKHIILSFQANIFVLIVSKLLNIKVLSRSNSSSTGWSKNIFKQFIFFYFFKKADEIIVNSFEFKKEMDKKYNINSKCILNPFNFKEIKKESKKKVKKIYKKNSLKLISVGRLTDQKDFLTTLKAMNILKNKNIELTIIGKGQNKEHLDRYIKINNLQKNIKFLGYKKNPFPFIRQADIFVLSSMFEGSPNVMIEALYLKKHIISTNCPTGPKEILQNGKYGDLIKIGDYKSLAKKILKFKLKNYRKKINVKLILEKYDYKKNCEEYYQLVNKYL